VLEDGLREPSRPRDPLPGAGGVRWAVEVPGRLDEGVVVRALCRQVGGGEACGYALVTRSCF
jgi:hypothetical protein